MAACDTLFLDAACFLQRGVNLKRLNNLYTNHVAHFVLRRLVDVCSHPGQMLP